MRIVASRSIALPPGPPRDALPRRSPDAATSTAAIIAAPTQPHRFAAAQHGAPDAGFVMQLIATASTSQPQSWPEAPRQTDRIDAAAAYGAAGGAVGSPGRRIFHTA